MSESLRNLLHGRASDAGKNDHDLTSGALSRARSLGRRRFAAAAVGVFSGIALAGVAAASLGLAPTQNPAPPTEETTSTPTVEATEESSQEPSEQPSEAVSEETPEEDNAVTEDCGRPSEDWTGWGDSGSATGPLPNSLPDTLYFEVHQDGAELTSYIVRYDGNQPTTVLDPEGQELFFLAPDGNRYVEANLCESSIAALDEGVEGLNGLGIDTQFCDPVWSPDSNYLVATVPSPEYDERYLLNVATGEQTDLPDEVSCEPRWSGGGEYLVSSDGRVAMRPDGSGRVELAGASAWTGDEEFSGLSSISADLSQACLQFDDAEIAGSGHVDPRRCDRYVDTATGEELDLPVETQSTSVTFLADGSMIIVDDQYGDIVLTLVDAGGVMRDGKTVPAQSCCGTFLVGYFTG